MLSDDPIFLLVRRAANGDEWIDYGTCSLTEEGCRWRYDIEQRGASRQYKEDNPPVRIIKRWLEERK